MSAHLDEDTVLAAARVVTGDRVHAPGWLAYRGDRITGVGGGRPIRVDRELGTAVVVPGFVDVHVHGGGGGSFGDDVAAARQTVATHRRHGTTSTMASLVSASAEELLRSVSVLADLYADGVVAGIHLEGPWISVARCGAHDPTMLRDPDASEVARLLAAGRGAISMVTLAPELPGSLRAIGQIVDAGAVAAVGHTDAGYDQVVQAIDAGARVATHLFNAMRTVHHRHPGPVVALLEDPRVSVELIADGVHLHAALYRHASTVAGRHRSMLVTDAMAGSGLGDGSYRLGRRYVTVAGGVARLAGTDTIAGSTTTMDRLFRTAALDGRGGLAPPPGADGERALLRAVRQTAVNPARTLGWADVGNLRPGLRADFVVLDQDLELVEVVRAGVTV